MRFKRSGGIYEKLFLLTNKMNAAVHGEMGGNKIFTNLFFCFFMCCAFGRVPTAQRTGKTGEMAKRNPLSGKTQGIWKFCQNTGTLFAQVANSLILKVKDMAIFAAKISIFFQKLDGSAKAVLCM